MNDNLEKSREARLWFKEIVRVAVFVMILSPEAREAARTAIKNTGSNIKNMSNEIKTRVKSLK